MKLLGLGYFSERSKGKQGEARKRVSEDKG
jgi:hypothetical protein